MKRVVMFTLKILKIIKTSFNSKLSYQFNTIPTNIQAGLFENIDYLILKFLWENKTARIPNRLRTKGNKIANLP